MTSANGARRRVTTLEEIKALALRQLEEGGPGAISLNAIARELGLTGPALYRYVRGRDELVTELVVDAYEALAAAVDDVGPSARPVEDLRATAHAYRRWALAHPSEYLLILGTPVPGYQAPARTTEAAHLAMAALLSRLGAAVDPPRPPRGAAGPLRAWLADRPGAEQGPAVAAAAVRAWTRLHGFVSLELLGHFAGLAGAVDALFAAEVDALLVELGAEEQAFG